LRENTSMVVWGKTLDYYSSGRKLKICFSEVMGGLQVVGVPNLEKGRERRKKPSKKKSWKELEEVVET